MLRSGPQLLTDLFIKAQKRQWLRSGALQRGRPRTIPVEASVADKPRQAMHKQRLPGSGPRLAEEVPLLAVAGSFHRPRDLSLHSDIVVCGRAGPAVESRVPPTRAGRAGTRLPPLGNSD